MTMIVNDPMKLEAVNIRERVMITTRALTAENSTMANDFREGR